MISRNRKLISGLLSALLVSGSASAGGVGSAAKSTVKLAGGVAALAATASVSYFAYNSFLVWNKLSVGDIGFYCCSEEELSKIFAGACNEYDYAASESAIFGRVKASAKVVKAVFLGVATKLRQLSGVEKAGDVKSWKNISLKRVVVDYVKNKEFLGLSGSEIVLKAVEQKIEDDVSNNGLSSYYGFLSKLYWKIVIGAKSRFSKDCWESLASAAKIDAAK